MTSPETRTLYLPPPEDSYPGAYIDDEFGTDDVIVDGREFTKITQQAIPWCTPHDRPAKLELDEGQDVSECTISQGGPDHEWWRDV